jgi:hypothetical protein
MKMNLIILLFSVLQLVSCDIGELATSIDQTRESIIPRLDNATSAIQNSPQQWKEVLDGLRGDLKADFAEEANRVETLTGTLNVQWQSGILCVMESVPKQAILAIKNLRAELLALALVKPEPTSCGTSMSQINLNDAPAFRTKITCSGYDLNDPSTIEAFLVRGVTLQKVDIIHFSSANQYTLDLASLSDGSLANNNALIVKYKTTGKKLNDFPIVQKSVAPVTTITAYFSPTGSMIFPLTRGDSEFGGHGPQIKVLFRIKISPDRRQLWYDLYFEAREIGGDYTTVSGSKIDLIGYTLTDNTKRIISITGDPNNNFTNYTKLMDFPDTNTKDNLGIQTAIGTFDIIGDTEGKDAGKTGIKAIAFTRGFAINIQ